MGLIKLEQIAGMNCHYYRYSLEYFFKSMEINGYQTVALWGGAPHFYLDYKTYDNCKIINKQARKYNQKIKCFTASSGTYGYQMCMQPKSQRDRCFDYFSNGIRAAAELGCSQMSVNSGWWFWNEKTEEAWNYSAEMLFRLANVAEREGITLTMESLRRAESQLAYNIENTLKLYNMVNHKCLKIMIDTTAVGVAGETMEQWFDAFGHEIVNTHFVDGTPYGHLVWGDGTHDLGKFLDVLKANNYDGLLGLEITADRYFKDPVSADYRNMSELKKFL